MSELSKDSNGLTTHQQLILDGFSHRYGEIPPPELVAGTDQAVAEMREKASGAFGLELENEKEFYDVMAGLSIGTKHMELLIEMGLSPKIAAEVTRTALAGLRPSR